MVRRTSVEAYNDIQKSGLLGERQKHAYGVLYRLGPMTGNELSNAMGMPGQWKRCSELKKRGVVEEVGEKVCCITGRQAIAWDVNGKHPVKAKEDLRKMPLRKRYEIVLKALKFHNTVEALNALIEVGEDELQGEIF